jgi:tetratricopeptide (TPR) repeat protein
MGKKKRKPISPTPSVPVAEPMPQPAPPETPPSLRSFFTPEDWIVALLTFLIAGFVFFYYMSPEVTLEDSGELVTGAFNFGVPHPTGYPTWAFLGWVWRHFVPFGNPAWRLGLFSVATGAALVGILTLLMSRSILMLLRNCPWSDGLSDSLRRNLSLSVGATAAMMFAFNRGVWQWACVPEMRALNAFSYVATTCFLFAWMMQPQQHRYIYALLGVWGLSLANHQTIIVMIFPFVIGMWLVGFLGDRTDKLRYSGLMEFGFACLVAWTVGVLANAWLLTGPNSSLWNQQIKTVLLFGPKSEPLPVVLLAGGSAAALLAFGMQQRMLNWKRATCCAVIFLAGLSMYAYMPIAASTNPPMNWGYAYTKQGFLHAITRGQYEQIRLSWPWTQKFWIQMNLFVQQLLKQYGWIIGAFAVLPAIVLIRHWNRLRSRARQWLIFSLTSFLVTWIGLIIVINPDIDKQNQEINLKFFVGAHGFFAMLIGYGIALAISWALSYWPKIPRRGVVAGTWILLACAALPFTVNRKFCEQRNHDFGYQFGYRMFRPGGGYPDMDRDAVLYGGTDPGRFVPTYMIFCESRVSPKDRYHDPYLDPAGGANFDRRDVYIITQNALADSTYMSYIRDHYDFSRPDPDNAETLLRRLPWQQWLFRWGWHHLHRDTMYPKEPIWIPSEQDTQRAFQEYVNQVQERKARGEQLSADEQVTMDSGQVQVRGVAGVMRINGILTKWIFDHSKDKHSFYVEESYVIDWMYPYLTPAGIIMKINRDPLPSPEKNMPLWTGIVDRDKAYWNKLCAEFEARPEFRLMRGNVMVRGDTDAQKTFSKLRSAIGGVYANRRLVVEAEYAYKQALQLCPESPEANFRLAQLYMELGRPDDALATLRALQKLDPLNEKIQTAVQQIIGLKQSRQDVSQLETARAGNPRDFGLLNQLAQAYSRAGQNDRIPPLLQSYLAQTNVSPDDVLQTAQVYMNVGRIDDALATLRLMMQRFPQDARAYFAFALVRTAQNNAAEAIPMLEKAIELAPPLRKQAAEDQRFSNLRTNPAFQKLIGSQ